MTRCLLVALVAAISAQVALASPLSHARALEPEVRRAFEAAGVHWPPAEVHLRVYKADDVLELWGRNAGEPFLAVREFAICARSGGLGPKRRMGDGQVPEGVYVIDRYNAQSAFHLSLGLDYPNASDRVRGSKPLGGDIFIHGSCVTIGCVPIEDGPVEELWVAVEAARGAGQRRIEVHAFPARMDAAHAALLARAAEGNEALAAFWNELAPIDAAFRETHLVPRVRVDASGRYVLVKPRGS